MHLLRSSKQPAPANCHEHRAARPAAGEMLHIAQPFLEKSMHPTVIVRGYVKALEDAIKIIDDLSFPVDVHDRDQMLKLVNSCIGTKFTNQFGDLMAVSGDWQQMLSAGPPRGCPQPPNKREQAVSCWHRHHNHLLAAPWW